MMWVTHPPIEIHGRRQTVMAVIGLAAVYLLAARLGLLWQLPGTQATPVWPPSGIALAAVWLLGSRVWPGIWLGAFLANAWDLVGGADVSFSTIPWRPLLAGTGIACGNAAEAVVGLALLRHWCHARLPFDQVRDVCGFAVIALLMSAVSAGIGPGALWFAGVLPAARLAPTAMTWWIGDVAGIAILTPLLLLWTVRPPRGWAPARVTRTVCMLVALLLMSLMNFHEWTALHLVQAHVYLLIPLLLWVIFRFGQQETVVAIGLIAVIAVWSTIKGLGPFAQPDRHLALLHLQGFLVILAFTALLLSAGLTEQRAAKVRLHEYAGQLDLVNRALLTATRRSEETGRELEAILHITSHDLREPLRAIENFLTILHEEYAPRLPADGQALFARVMQAAERLRRLLNDLIDLSQARGAVGPREDLDGQIIVQDVLIRLRAKIQETNATVKTAPAFGRLSLDRTWATHALYNLVLNALKFSRNGDAPQIEIAPYAPPPNESSVGGFVVHDRGPGVPAEQRERIFGLFQRGVGREIDGTGAGLAIVREVARRHGGHAWVESRVGGGATFVFTVLHPSAAPRPEAR